MPLRLVGIASHELVILAVGMGQQLLFDVNFLVLHCFVKCPAHWFLKYIGMQFYLVLRIILVMAGLPAYFWPCALVSEHRFLKNASFQTWLKKDGPTFVCNNSLCNFIWLCVIL